MEFKIARTIRKATSMLKKRYEKYPDWVAYEPSLLPTLSLMRHEGIHNLEEWFRWAEEWRVYLAVYGNLQSTSDILEIGCGLGRIAYPLRSVLRNNGSYIGFDIAKFKINFLKQVFEPKYSNFSFIFSDIHNSEYNLKGQIDPADYEFPFKSTSFDLVYAASVFTHLVPETTARYLHESSRVLRPGGRCVFSFFLLDNYKKNQIRPLGFSQDYFNFDQSYKSYGEKFRTVDSSVPDRMTAYQLSYIKELAMDAGLELDGQPVSGIWSGTSSTEISAQDLLVLKKIK